ncbi:MAG: RDD family protein [Chloroflexi bacterium]|nr:MAG: RDD family protein [Chloroflexota bacterium]
MSSGFATVRCLHCGSYTQGGQFCADCVERQRSEEEARAERVAQSIADRPGSASGSSPAGSLCPSCGRFASPDAKFCGYCRFSFQGIPDVQRASTATGQRLIAGLIDGFLMVVLFTVMALAFADVEQGSGNNQTVRVGLWNEQFLLYLAILYGYYVVLEMLFGATIGKLILGLRVIKVSGAPYGLGAVLIRNLIRFVDSFPFGLYVVGLLFIAATEKKQRLGDIVAGTAVVKASTANARPGPGMSPFV